MGNQLDFNWQKFRELMPIAEKWAYFDHAAVSPLPQPASEAIRGWLDQATADGDVHWPDWASQVEKTRAAAARLIDADLSEIGLIPNTSTGIGLVAEGFPWKAGDNVVTFTNEFPSNQLPWMHLQDRGVEIRSVPVEVAVDPQKLAEAIDSRTRIVAISWVGFATGWRIDVDEIVQIAHERGALVFLDAIQGLGVFPLNVRTTPVDFLAADGHKWMLGPEGAGLFFVQSEHLDLLRPINIGWNSVKNAYNYDAPQLAFRNTAARYEGGSMNIVGMLGFGASLDLLLSAGAGPEHSTLAHRVLELTDYACQQLHELGATLLTQRAPGHNSGIVTFQMPGREPGDIRRACREAEVIVSCRGGGVRIAAHAYNNHQDIDRLLRVLSEV